MSLLCAFFLRAALFVSLVVCTVVVGVVAASQKQAKRNGSNFLDGQWSAPRYNSTTAIDSLRELRVGAGADWIALTYCSFQKDVDSTGPIYPRASTPSKAELQFIVQSAHANGTSVFFRPCIDPDWSNPQSKGTWRGEIGRKFTPSDWDTWFSAYTEYIVRQAMLAQELHVDLFAVGMEYVTPSLQASHWRKVVAAVRRVFSGPLTYCANHGNEHAVSWWDVLDEISIDAYYELAPDVVSPTRVQLVRAWKPVTDSLSNLSAAYGNKPISFGEIGYCSVTHANRVPWMCGESKELNLTAQSELYEAFFEAVYTQSWFSGVFWWAWLTTPTDGGPQSTGFTPRGKPAEKVMHKYYMQKAIRL